MTDEDAVILVIEPLQSGAQHRGDDGAFVLGWHEDRDEAGGFRLRGKVGGEAARRDCRSSAAPEAAAEIDDVDGKVVEPEQQEAHAREQGEFRGDPRQDFGGGHWERSSTGGLRPCGHCCPEYQRSAHGRTPPQNHRASGSLHGSWPGSRLIRCEPRPVRFRAGGRSSLASPRDSPRCVGWRAYGGRRVPRP